MNRFQPRLFKPAFTQIGHTCFIPRGLKFLGLLELAGSQSEGERREAGPVAQALPPRRHGQHRRHPGDIGRLKRKQVVE